MYLEIISPEAILYQGEVKSISFPGSYGDFQVLDNHAPIVSTLKKGQVKIQGKLSIDQEVKSYFNFSDKDFTSSSFLPTRCISSFELCN